MEDEFYPDLVFYGLSHARDAVKNTAEIYNSRRLHLSSGYKSPNSVFENVA
jgi:transposase InsO family protein